METRSKKSRRKSDSEAKNISDLDIQHLAKAIAPLLVKNVQASHHEFWIDPESHYKDHLAGRQLALIFDPDMIAALKEISTSYKKGKNMFWKVFIGLAVFGLIISAFQGWLFGKPH